MSRHSGISETHDPLKSNMRREIEEIPTAVEQLLSRSGTHISRLAAEIRSIDPRFFLTIARGSSDHCCGFLKYIFEIYGGRPVTSMGPSVASIYGTTLALDKSVTLSISQSGNSPDIIEATRKCVAGGTRAIGITNSPDSPLSKVCNHTINIQAGPELSVAATKTFLCSAVSGLLLFAKWKEDDALKTSLHRLPELCEAAIKADWSALADALANRNSLYVLGRGPSLPIAEEIALKFKEVCQIHAEAYSSAEVLHGPVSLIEPGFLLLSLVPDDAARTPSIATMEHLIEKKAEIVTNMSLESTKKIQSTSSGSPIIDPLLNLVSFYACIEQVASQRGIDPDSPPHLKKVTETI